MAAVHVGLYPRLVRLPRRSVRVDCVVIVVPLLATAVLLRALGVAHLVPLLERTRGSILGATVARLLVLLLVAPVVVLVARVYTGRLGTDRPLSPLQPGVNGHHTVTIQALLTKPDPEGTSLLLAGVPIGLLLVPIVMARLTDLLRKPVL